MHCPKCPVSVDPRGVWIKDPIISTFYQNFLRNNNVHKWIFECYQNKSWSWNCSDPGDEKQICSFNETGLFSLKKLGVP